MFGICFKKMLPIKPHFFVVGATTSIACISGYFSMFHLMTNYDIQMLNQTLKTQINKTGKPSPPLVSTHP